jgi:hypothetical protein
MKEPEIRGRATTLRPSMLICAGGAYSAGCRTCRVFEFNENTKASE